MWFSPFGLSVILCCLTGHLTLKKYHWGYFHRDSQSLRSSILYGCTEVRIKTHLYSGAFEPSLARTVKAIKSFQDSSI